MIRPTQIVLIAIIVAAAALAQPHPLLVISVDGLDIRYLRDADPLGLKIPTLRRLMNAGAMSDGVVGIVPTVTWPSHTTIITGVPPSEHGILTNDQPGQPGQRWWFTSFLRARTLWEAAQQAGRKTATVYWPVTVGAKVDFNFPEFWEKRDGHSIPFTPIASKATPGLEERVTAAYPSFPRSQWTDTGAMQAVRFLLETEKPGLILVHIADLDSEAHEFGAFGKHAKAVLEHADYLIGWALEKLPRGMVVAIVSDHGFENAVKLLRPASMLKEAGVAGSVNVSQGLIGTSDAAAAAFFRQRAGKPDSGIAREVPMEEVRRLAPSLTNWNTAFETSTGYRATSAAGAEAISPGDGRGDHGLWPTRSSYRATFLLWGEPVRGTRFGEIDMLEIGPTLAQILGVDLPAAKKPSLWPRLKK